MMEVAKKMENKLFKVKKIVNGKDYEYLACQGCIDSDNLEAGEEVESGRCKVCGEVVLEPEVACECGWEGFIDELDVQYVEHPRTGKGCDFEVCPVCKETQFTTL